IEPARRHAFGDGVGLARRTHAVNDVVAFAPALDERADQLGRVLQVDIHRNKDIAAGVVYAGGESRLLAEIARKVDHANAFVAAAAVEQMPERLVARAVVHEHDLETQPRLVEEWFDRGEEELD